MKWHGKDLDDHIAARLARLRSDSPDVDKNDNYHGSYRATQQYGARKNSHFHQSRPYFPNRFNKFFHPPPHRNGSGSFAERNIPSIEELDNSFSSGKEDESFYSANEEFGMEPELPCADLPLPPPTPPPRPLSNNNQHCSFNNERSQEPWKTNRNFQRSSGQRPWTYNDSQRNSSYYSNGSATRGVNYNDSQRNSSYYSNGSATRGVNYNFNSKPYNYKQQKNQYWKNDNQRKYSYGAGTQNTSYREQYEKMRTRYLATRKSQQGLKMKLQNVEARLEALQAMTSEHMMVPVYRKY